MNDEEKVRRLQEHIATQDKVIEDLRAEIFILLTEKENENAD